MSPPTSTRLWSKGLTQSEVIAPPLPGSQSGSQCSGLALSDSDDQVRGHVIKVLGEMCQRKESDAVPLIAAALNDPDSMNQKLAMNLLAFFSDDRVTDALIKHLGDGSANKGFPPLGEVAVQALVHVGPQAAGKVVGLLKHNDAQVRRRAAIVLGKVGDEQVLPALRELAGQSPERPDCVAAKNAADEILSRTQKKGPL